MRDLPLTLSGLPLSDKGAKDAARGRLPPLRHAPSDRLKVTDAQRKRGSTSRPNVRMAAARS